MTTARHAAEAGAPGRGGGRSADAATGGASTSSAHALRGAAEQALEAGNARTGVAAAEAAQAEASARAIRCMRRHERAAAAEGGRVDRIGATEPARSRSRSEEGAAGSGQLHEGQGLRSGEPGREEGGERRYQGAVTRRRAWERMTDETGR